MKKTKDYIFKYLFCFILILGLFFGFQPALIEVAADSGLEFSGQDLNNLTPAQLQQLNLVKNDQTENGTNVAKLVGLILQIAYSLSLIVLTVMLVWGGIQIMTAGTTGKSAGADNGKKRIMAAIIGYLIVMGSFLLIKLIEAFLKIDIPGI